jgi:hypothetical protein
VSQVQQLFPHLALATVIEDLRVTRSVELTIENVLDGQVVAPPPMFQRDTDPPPLPELEYSPGLSDMAAPHWDDITENHDPDRSVSNQCDCYNHRLILFTQVGQPVTAFFILLCPLLTLFCFCSFRWSLLQSFIHNVHFMFLQEHYFIYMSHVHATITILIYTVHILSDA